MGAPEKLHNGPNRGRLPWAFGADDGDDDDANNGNEGADADIDGDDDDAAGD